MTSRMRRDRTMSTRLPPHVELIRELTANTLSATSSTRPPGHHAAHLGLLAERDHVGRDTQLLVGPSGSGHPAAGLHLVEDEQRVELVAQLAHRGEELRPEVAVAALALDRLGDEAGDVVRVRLEGRPGLRAATRPPPHPCRRRAGCTARRCAASRTSGTARPCSGRCWSATACSRCGRGTRRAGAAPWCRARGRCRAPRCAGSSSRTPPSARSRRPARRRRRRTGAAAPGRRARGRTCRRTAPSARCTRRSCSACSPRPCASSARNASSSASAGWFMPSADDAKKVNMSR